ncbi:MAG: negative regulator of flagellin synthesis FlgM [Bermanella sp.]|jgi:negative regulator of flagellin synthesis FlgM
MVDKIDSSGIQPRRPEVTAGKVSEASAGGRPQVSEIPAVNPFESRELSSTSTYEQLKQRVNDSDSVDRQKVEDIKAALKRGEFTIDVSRVANAVVELEHLLAS